VTLAATGMLALALSPVTDAGRDGGARSVALAHDGHTPAHLQEFMWAVGEVESNGDYTARNRRTGAYGKYQIMPGNWPAWAERYIGDPKAPRTPQNQELVARGKFIDLHEWLGSWDLVARWWLTGSDERDRSKWGDSRRYVDKVMVKYRYALVNGLPTSDHGAARGPGAVDAATVVRPGQPGSGTEAAPSTIGTTRSALRAIWLRTVATVDRRRLLRLPEGSRFQVVATRRGGTGTLWLQVRLDDGRTGWVDGRHTVQA
jgi:hypothetical protein